MSWNSYKTVYEVTVIMIAGILRTALLKKVLDTFLTGKDINRLTWKIVFVGYYLTTTAAFIAFHVSDLYGLCNLAAIAGMVCFYRGAWEKKIWVSMFFFCMDTGGWVVVAFAGSEEIRMRQSAVQALILLVCAVVVCRIPDPKEDREIALDRKQMFLLSGIPVLTAAVFWQMTCGTVDRLTGVFLCAGVMALNLCVFYLYHILLKNYVQLREQDVYKQQTIAYQNQLDVIMETQGRVRALRHDMKNHVLALEGLARGSEPEKLIEYLESMEEFMGNPCERVYTANEALDSLLNFKLRKAGEELKRVEADIVLPENMRLGSFDLNVIVGNLLDNGAAAAMETDERFLKLSMGMENGVLFLFMVNSCLGIPEGVCDIRRLSQKSAPGHGLGLAIFLIPPLFWSIIAWQRAVFKAAALLPLG